MPSPCILAIKVVRGRPSRAAVPFRAPCLLESLKDMGTQRSSIVTSGDSLGCCYDPHSPPCPALAPATAPNWIRFVTQLAAPGGVDAVRFCEMAADCYSVTLTCPWGDFCPFVWIAPKDFATRRIQAALSDRSRSSAVSQRRISTPLNRTLHSTRADSTAAASHRGSNTAAEMAEHVHEPFDRSHVLSSKIFAGTSCAANPARQSG